MGQELMKFANIYFEGNLINVYWSLSVLLYLDEQEVEGCLTGGAPPQSGATLLGADSIYLSTRTN